MFLFVLSAIALPRAQGADCFDPAICRTECEPSEAQIGVCAVATLKCCLARVAPVTNVTVQVKNPLGFDTVEGVLGSLLGTLQAIIAILSLIFIVIFNGYSSLI